MVVVVAPIVDPALDEVVEPVFRLLWVLRHTIMPHFMTVITLGSSLVSELHAFWIFRLSNIPMQWTDPINIGTSSVCPYPPYKLYGRSFNYNEYSSIKKHQKNQLGQSVLKRGELHNGQ